MPGIKCKWIWAPPLLSSRSQRDHVRLPVDGTQPERQAEHVPEVLPVVQRRVEVVQSLVRRVEQVEHVVRLFEDCIGPKASRSSAFLSAPICGPRLQQAFTKPRPSRQKPRFEEDHRRAVQLQHTRCVQCTRPHGTGCTGAGRAAHSSSKYVARAARSTRARLSASRPVRRSRLAACSLASTATQLATVG